MTEDEEVRFVENEFFLELIKAYEQHLKKLNVIESEINDALKTISHLKYYLNEKNTTFTDDKQIDVFLKGLKDTYSASSAYKKHVQLKDFYVWIPSHEL